MRVPLLVRGPRVVPAKLVVDEIVANIDIAPTILDITGVKQFPQQFEGKSLLSLAKGQKIPQWRDELLYEYYWEFNYPSTPTTFALRTDDYKFINPLSNDLTPFFRRTRLLCVLGCIIG
jgi:N-acetylglucosamine-6-sulfatase